MIAQDQRQQLIGREDGLVGVDLVAALANGARACLAGRACLHGLMAGGQAGVDRALQILSDEIARTLRLLGMARIDDLEPSMARLPGNAS